MLFHVTEIDFILFFAILEGQERKDRKAVVFLW